MPVPLVDPQVTCASAQLGYKPGVPTVPSSGSIMCESNSQNSGKPFTYAYWFIKKDVNQEQPNERDAQGKV